MARVALAHLGATFNTHFCHKVPILDQKGDAELGRSMSNPKSLSHTRTIQITGISSLPERPWLCRWFGACFMFSQRWKNVKYDLINDDLKLIMALESFSMSCESNTKSGSVLWVGDLPAACLLCVSLPPITVIQQGV